MGKNPDTTSKAGLSNSSGILGGKPTYGGKEYALSALANVGSGRGLIPSLIGGLGQVYMANKENEAANAAAIQKETSRRGGQSALGEMAGIDPRYMQGLAGGDDATLKQALDQQGNLTAGSNANNQIDYIKKMNPAMGDIPYFEGSVPLQAQGNMLNNLFDVFQKLPEMEKIKLGNQILQATQQSTIGATNARNQADIQYAVPQAGATLKGTQLGNEGKVLSNQGQRIDNQYAPQIKQGTIRNQNLTAQQMQHKIQHESAAQALGLTLQKMQQDYPDPAMFRGMGMDFLRKSNLPPEGVKAGMDSIDNMIIMKKEADKANAMKQQSMPGQPQQKKPSGLFGVNF